jgi:NADH-quinone oxidoreductase subunit J
MNMTIVHLIFYVFAFVAVSAAMMVVLARNPVRSVLFLVLTFFATAGVWLILHAEFLALILVLVYVGAVMTLFLFVVMMLSIHLEKVREGFVRYLPFGIIMAAMILAISVMAVGPEHFGLTQMPVPGLKPADYNNLTSLGLVLYTEYVYPFEISAVLLLTAIVAAISLTHRKTKNRKSQRVSAQIAVKPQDRLRILNIPSESKYKPSGTGE